MNNVCCCVGCTLSEVKTTVGHPNTPADENNYFHEKRQTELITKGRHHNPFFF